MRRTQEIRCSPQCTGQTVTNKLFVIIWPASRLCPKHFPTNNNTMTRECCEIMADASIVDQEKKQVALAVGNKLETRYISYLQCLPATTSKPRHGRKACSNGNIAPKTNVTSSSSAQSHNTLAREYRKYRVINDVLDMFLIKANPKEASDCICNYLYTFRIIFYCP